MKFKSVFLAVSMTILLAGCFGPTKFDASSGETIKKSTEKIMSQLPDEKREEFSHALSYFMIGGEEGMKSTFKLALESAFSGKSIDSSELKPHARVQELNGLTGEEIIEKYKNAQMISSLKSEAEKLLKNNKFQEALGKYETMGAIPSGSEKAQDGIENTSKAIKEFEEKASYFSKIKITEFTAKRIDTWSKKNIPAVRFSLKNIGERSLDKVKVLVFFYDKNGKVIYEKNYHPVLVGGFLSDDKPLKPGYIDEMEVNNYHTLNSTLSEWQEGKATIKVVDIEFSK